MGRVCWGPPLRRGQVLLSVLAPEGITAGSNSVPFWRISTRPVPLSRENLRFPLIFISGIFVPLAQMQGLGLALAYCSPLTYLVDLFNAAMSGTSAFSPAIDCAVLIGVSALFIFAARDIQKRNLVKGMQRKTKSSMCYLKNLKFPLISLLTWILLSYGVVKILYKYDVRIPEPRATLSLLGASHVPAFPPGY